MELKPPKNKKTKRKQYKIKNPTKNKTTRTRNKTKRNPYNARLLHSNLAPYL